MSVAEATRNVAITGARPLGVTNCLNYGDPTRPEAFWQLTEGVRGLADACRALGLPVTGGNVSLYNESPAGAIAPTPEIGVVGLLEDVGTLVRPGWRAAGDRILLVGESTPGLAGSAYAALAGLAAEDGPPSLDLDRERRVQAFVREAAERGLLASAQDVSGGGLAVALAECCLWAGDRHGPGHRRARPAAASRARRRSTCSARARRGSSSRPCPVTCPPSSSSPASTACRSGSSARSGRPAAASTTRAATRRPRGSSSSSTAPARPAPRRIAAAGSRTP